MVREPIFCYIDGLKAGGHCSRMQRRVREEDLDDRVVHFTTADNRWDIGKLSQVLHDEICKRGMAIIVLRSNRGMDNDSWLYGKSSHFSVKKAHLLIVNVNVAIHEIIGEMSGNGKGLSGFNHFYGSSGKIDSPPTLYVSSVLSINLNNGCSKEGSYEQ
ncbi:hypothetical protein Syun_014268 [Stephania yunnanensis]|uniref:Uncharacterized protein n=1 Tax=Stephania yunnanensis TaxID=152371 RepID=A0AAP0JIZ9_9MAGN